MDNTIKTREIVHDIKTKDNGNHLTHFIKTGVIQTKPVDFENNREDTSIETNSANKVQKVLKKTSITTFERAKDYTKNKIKTKREQSKVIQETIFNENAIPHPAPARSRGWPAR